MITEELKIALPRTGSVGRSHVVAERPLDLAVCSKHHSVLFDLNTAGCLGRRRRVGRLVVLAPDDRTLPWHSTFDPGTPSPPSAGHCVSSLRRRARRDLSGLRSMGCFSSAALLPRSPSSRGPATGQPSGSRPMELAQRGVRGSPLRARLSAARDVLPKRAGEALAAVPQGAGRPRYRRSDRRAGKP
jgi:hypothetical protein